MYDSNTPLPAERWTLDQIAPGAVVASGLDNQSTPLALVQGGRSPQEEAQHIRSHIGAELRRALALHEQVICNRAFMLNAAGLQDAFRHRGAGRSAFVSLLESGAFVVHLYKEEHAFNLADYSVDEAGHRAVRDLAVDTRIPCLRMSWDDAENSARVAVLGRAFTDRLSRFDAISAKSLHVLGIEPTVAAHLAGTVLPQVADMARNTGEAGQSLTRQVVYDAFIAPKGEAHLRYRLLPGAHVRALKHMVDLAYCLGLPDLLGRRALTPHDNAPRDLIDASLEGSAELDAPGIFEIGRAVARLKGAVAPLPVPPCWSDVALADIVRLRQEEVWREHIVAGDELFAVQGLDEPERLSHLVAEHEKASNRLLRKLHVIRSGADDRPASRGASVIVQQQDRYVELLVTQEGPVVRTSPNIDDVPARPRPAATSIRVCVRDGRRKLGPLEETNTIVSAQMTDGPAGLAEIAKGLRSLPDVADGGTQPHPGNAADQQRTS